MPNMKYIYKEKYTTLFWFAAMTKSACGSVGELVVNRVFYFPIGLNKISLFVLVI